MWWIKFSYKKFDIGQVSVGNGNADSQTYKDFVQATIDKKLQPSVPLKGKTFTLGSATFKFYDHKAQYKDANDNSLVALYVIGNNKFLFIGDSGKKVETTSLLVF